MKDISVDVEDFVVKVSGDVTLAKLDQKLKESKQESFLQGPKNYSISQILTENWGNNCRKSCLGLSVKDKSGQITKIGGKVIKNVSGFDLAKLYIGSNDDLVSIESAYLRLGKLASYQAELTYQFIDYPDDFFIKLRNLQLSWDDFFIESQPNPYIVCLKLFGDEELVKLRVAKIKRYFTKPAKIEEGPYKAKKYDSTDARLEIYTKASNLHKLARLMIANLTDLEIKIMPLESRLDIYLGASGLDRAADAYRIIKDKLSHIPYYAHLYPLIPEAKALLEEINQHSNKDEQKILAKLKEAYAK